MYALISRLFLNILYYYYTKEWNIYHAEKLVSLGILLEGTVSQIFHLRPSFHLMTKNRKLFEFF